MNRNRMLVGGVGLLGVSAMLALTAVSRGQEGEKPAEGMDVEQAAMMAEWMKLGQPSEHHKHLDYFVGNWKTVTKMWMEGPGKPPTESDGTSEVKWALNGRFTMDHHKGTMMGQPYEGIGFMGYNNYRNLYTGTWASNMGTELLTFKGTRHPETGVFTMYGEMDEPMLKVIGRTVKYVSRIVDKDHYVFEIIDLHAGDDYKVIEITYTRQ